MSNFHWPKILGYKTERRAEVPWVGKVLKYLHCFVTILFDLDFATSSMCVSRRHRRVSNRVPIDGYKGSFGLSANDQAAVDTSQRAN